MDSPDLTNDASLPSDQAVASTLRSAGLVALTCLVVYTTRWPPQGHKLTLPLANLVSTLGYFVFEIMAVSAKGQAKANTCAANSPLYLFYVATEATLFANRISIFHCEMPPKAIVAQRRVRFLYTACPLSAMLICLTMLSTQTRVSSSTYLCRIDDVSLILLALYAVGIVLGTWLVIEGCLAINAFITESRQLRDSIDSIYPPRRESNDMSENTKYRVLQFTLVCSGLTIATSLLGAATHLFKRVIDLDLYNAVWLACDVVMSLALSAIVLYKLARSTRPIINRYAPATRRIRANLTPVDASEDSKA